MLTKGAFLMAKQVRSSRKIKSPEQMGALWEEYKEKCDNYTIKRTEFSQRLGKFVTEEIPKRISYTIEGFCAHIGLSKDALYTTYFGDPNYSDVTTRIHIDCETDVRSKFETGEIPPQLSALWMSKFGYSTKIESNGGQKTNDLLSSLMDLERGEAP